MFGESRARTLRAELFRRRTSGPAVQFGPFSRSPTDCPAEETSGSGPTRGEDMARRPTRIRPLANLAITIGILALSPSLLRAAVIVNDSTLFTVTIDSNDTVSMDCSGGFVRVFDDGTPMTYTT